MDRTYSSHHDGIVRSFLVDEVLGCLVTGGEDGTLHLWDLTPPNTPSKPGKKRELDFSREGDDMDVDHVQDTQASTLEIHHLLSPLMPS